MRDDRTMRDNSVQSVHRAISILQVLAIHGAAGVTEIAVELSVHKSTVFRLLATLEARGLVEQNGERGRYRLAYGVVQLATGATKMDDLSLLSRPVCRQLADTVRETVNVVVHDGRAVISIDQVLGAPAVTTVNWVGQRTPMHATSAGKVFMAHMDPEQLDALLEEGLETYTPHTIVDPVAVKRELALVRKRGYAQTMDEHEIGLAAIGGPYPNPRRSCHRRRDGLRAHLPDERGHHPRPRRTRSLRGRRDLPAPRIPQAGLTAT